LAIQKLTTESAALIKLMDAYAALDYSRTLLEVQKLAYFLQAAGEPLRLRYETGHYGPYAENLNKVLEVMEGHFMRGYGDSQKPYTEIELLPGAVDAATAFLADKPESRQRLEQVVDLIEGFETPYGMELLASVHWAAHHASNGFAKPAGSSAEAGERVRTWNACKARLFKTEHVTAAWQQLDSAGWLSAEPQGASIIQT
jgi:hypothetical protein